MRIPQAAERLKEAPGQALRAVLSKEAPAQQALRAVLSKDAPAQALRAVFSGVGQVLLVTERVRRRAMGEDQEAAAQSTEGAAAVAQAAPAAAGTVSAAKPADRKTTPDTPATNKASTSTAKSGTAKTGTAKASAPKARASEPRTPADTAKTAAKAAPAAARSAKTAAPETSAKPADTPPIPHYSELTVASLRARMRGLDATQLRGLVSYERAHEDRETVIAMFERRIAKLDAEGPAGQGSATG